MCVCIVRIQLTIMHYWTRNRENFMKVKLAEIPSQMPPLGTPYRVNESGSSERWWQSKFIFITFRTSANSSCQREQQPLLKLHHNVPYTVHMYKWWPQNFRKREEEKHKFTCTIDSKDGPGKPGPLTPFKELDDK